MADTRNGGGTEKAKRSTRKRTTRGKNVAAAAKGVAIGIGSAALVAALLYANRPKEDEGSSVIDTRFEPRES